MKPLALRRLGYFSAAVGKEVGFSMVRKSPFSSWTRGASITPTGAKGQLCPRSTFVRFLFGKVPTLTRMVGRGSDGSASSAWYRPSIPHGIDLSLPRLHTPHLSDQTWSTL